MGSYLQEYRARIGAWAGRLSSCAARAYRGPATWRGDGALGAVSLSATVIAVLLVIGGIEQNPGPVVSAAVSACDSFIQIVCRGCGKNLSSGWRCESCGDWFHKSCGNVKRGQGEGWVCPKCKEQCVRRLEEELRSARSEIADLKAANKALNEQLAELRAKTATPLRTETANENARGSCLVLGDSIVRHVGKQDSKLRVECLPGIRTDQLKRFVENHELGAPNKIVLHVGTNDLKAKSNEFIMGDIYDLVSATKKKFPRATIVVSGVLRRRDMSWRRIGHMNDLMSWVTEAHKVHFVDPNCWVQDSDFGRDGLHLNRRGADSLGRLYSRVCNSMPNTD